jgi:hypothetical protein
MKPLTIDVWDLVIDGLLGWRNEKHSHISAATVDNAITGAKALRLQSPAPNTIHTTDDGRVIITWRTELQDMVATYNEEGGKIVLKSPNEI